MEASTAPMPSSSGMASGLSLAGALAGEAPLEGGGEGEDAPTNGAVRRRAGDNLPMEVT